MWAPTFPNLSPSSVDYLWAHSMSHAFLNISEDSCVRLNQCSKLPILPVGFLSLSYASNMLESALMLYCIVHDLSIFLSAVQQGMCPKMCAADITWA